MKTKAETQDTAVWRKAVLLKLCPLGTTTHRTSKSSETLAMFCTVRLMPPDQFQLRMAYQTDKAWLSVKT